MDSDQAGPSRPHQPVLLLREAETELDPEILSGLLAHYNFDDTKLSGAAIINQEVNGIFDDLEQMKGLLLEMKGWKAADVMQGFESAYTAVEHAISRVSIVAEEVGDEVACALRSSLRDLREYQIRRRGSAVSRCSDLGLSMGIDRGILALEGEFRAAYSISRSGPTVIDQTGPGCSQSGS